MANPNFRERPDRELERLSDEDLIEYIVGARDAARLDACNRAGAILVHGYWDIVVARCRLKVPPADAEDVAGQAVVSAITTFAFAGGSIGEFRGWLHTIVDRRIADYHRARERKPPPEALPETGGDEDAAWGVEPWEEGETDAIDVQSVVDQAFAELSETHQRVVELYGFEDLSAADAAEQIPDMTEANVHQIYTRFRARLRELLAEADEGDTPP
ncbi:MAG: RNA polymerase sigma factor [Thermoleophilaceae bacterium]